MKWYRPFYINMVGAALWAAPVYASAQEGAHAVGIGWPFFFKVLNFSVLAYVLARLAKKHLPSFLKSRSESVSEAILRAEAREKEAHDLLREYDKKLGDLGQLMESMLNQARVAAESERQRLIAAAESEAKDILESATRSAKNLERRLESEARRQTLKSALELAQRQVKELLQGKEGETLQAAMIEQFATDIHSMDIHSRVGSRERR